MVTTRAGEFRVTVSATGPIALDRRDRPGRRGIRPHRGGAGPGLPGHHGAAGADQHELAADQCDERGPPAGSTQP